MKLRVIYEPSGRAREYSPLAVNLYRGCDHRCSYCYAPQMLHMDRREFQRPQPRKKLISNLEKDVAILDAVGDMRPILMCFTCDPYCKLDNEIGLTRIAIGILKRYHRAVHVLTKGGMRAANDFDLLDEHDAHAATLTFSNADDSHRWEPGAAEPADRIRALHVARKFGLKTWASMEPVIDPAQSLALIEMTADVVQLYKLGAWNYDTRARGIDWVSYYHHARSIIEKAGRELLVKDDLKKIVGRG